MSDLRTAAQQALEALENALDAQSNPARREFPTIHDFGQMRRAHIALRAALAQQEQEQEQYKLRIRATNNKSLTMPTAQIVSVTKSGTTTGTFVTEMPHKLVPGDLAVYYGPSDTAHDENQEPLCKGIPRRGCNYLAPCDTVCNKCGKVHAHHQMVAQFQAAQEEQEPVAYRHSHDGEWEYYDAPTGEDCSGCQSLYTHPPRREWQSLTEEEIGVIALQSQDGISPYDDTQRFARAVEQACKEKNA
jgi:ribosomal protein L32